MSKSKPDPHDSLWKLTTLLLLIAAMLVARDCYMQAHPNVCTCKGHDYQPESMLEPLEVP